MLKWVKAASLLKRNFLLNSVTILSIEVTDSSLSNRAITFTSMQTVNKGNKSEAVTLALNPCPPPNIINLSFTDFRKW